MSDLQTLKSRIIRQLTASRHLAGCDIIEGFSGIRDLLSGPTIAMGLSSVDLSPAGLGGFSAEQSHHNPGGVAITLSFDLYHPGKDSAPAFALYESLCTALLGLAGQIGLVRIFCDPLRRSEQSSAWHLPAKAELRAALIGEKLPPPGSDSGGITHFILRSETNA